MVRSDMTDPEEEAVTARKRGGERPLSTWEGYISSDFFRLGSWSRPESCSPCVPMACFAVEEVHAVGECCRHRTALKMFNDE